MARPTYDPLPYGGEVPASVAAAAPATQVRRISEFANRLQNGKLNVVLDVTLTAGSDTTDLIDARLSYYSALLFCPRTANARVAEGSLFVSAQGDGTATLTHQKNAQTDRVFRVVVIG